MTDTSTENNAPQPGWWQASDGNWYPPQQGSPAAPPPPAGYAPPATNGLATGSMVTGIIALVMFWAFGLSVIIGIIAIVLGAVALSKANNLPNQVGRGQAIAGIVTGVLGALGGVFLLVGIAALGQEAEREFRQVGEQIESDFDEINSDPSDGFCNEDRFMQDPDC